MDNNNNTAILNNLAPVAPPVAISGAMFLGLSLSDWVYVVTIAYTLIGICTMIKKYWIDPYYKRRIRKRHNNEI